MSSRSVKTQPARRRLQCKPGKIVIVSSPSGGGKTSICRKLLSPARRDRGWRFSVSYTTRQKRPGERNGREYFFVNEDEFQQLVAADFFAEHFKVHLYHYGTPRRPLQQAPGKGDIMLLDVDVQGALRLKKEYPDALTIFILPPSIASLKQRLRKRGTETSDHLTVRFQNARKEMRLYPRFEYVVVNKELSEAVSRVLSIVEAHHCRTDKLNPEQMKRISG
ncbi:MAG: guanylate kinase [candidate division Zixibacteria bacterium]|nr:guanylate kinase [candidate division Zixibacteria bacterium]